MASVLQRESTAAIAVTLRPLRRDAAGRRIDPEYSQLLNEAARLRVPLAPGPSPGLLTTARTYAGAAIALIVSTPMSNGFFRGVEVWTTDAPPAPCDYEILENGALSGRKYTRQPSATPDNRPGEQTCPPNCPVRRYDR